MWVLFIIGFDLNSECLCFDTCKSLIVNNVRELESLERTF